MTRAHVGLLAVAFIVAGLAVGAGIFLLRPVTPTAAAGAPRFIDETNVSGVTHRYDGSATFQVGGGVAVFD